MPGFRVSLADLLSCAMLAGCTYFLLSKAIDVYEYQGIGSSLVPWVVAFFVLSATIRHYRKEGNNITAKCGILRARISGEINRVLVPDPPGSEELFIVVTSENRPEDEQPKAQALWDSVLYGLKVKEKPRKRNQIPGSVYWLQKKMG
jgi:hypothetical protein